MKRLSLVSVGLALLLAGSRVASAQSYVEGVSAIISSGTTSTQIETYSETYETADIAEYYEAYVEGYLYQNGSLIADGYSLGDPYENDAYGYMTEPLHVPDTYEILSDHYLVAYYTYYDPNNGVTYYDNPDYFIDSGSEGGGYDFTPGNSDCGCYYETADYIYLGSTEVEMSSAPPVINSISPTGILNGNSGTLTVDGSNLVDVFTQLTTATVSGSGITWSVSSQTDTQVLISYSVSTSAAAGSRTLTLSTRFGSSSATFNVGDATPVVTGIDPSDWDAGTTQSVTFTGQNFGTNAPTLSFSPSGGISYSLTSYNDTQIVANITVASGTPNETVDVTVTNNGYSGSGFTAGSGQSAKSSPVQANIHAPVKSSEVTVIGWVNGSAPDLVTLPSGANATLISNLNSSGKSCALEVAIWSFTGVAKNLSTQSDRDYANAWLVAHSANSTPPSTITPSTEYSGGNYRLFNDFGNGKGGYNVGITPDPCKFLGQTITGWLANGQPSKYMGQTGMSGSGKIYQNAEGRIGKVGQSGSQTINQGRTVPYIYSVIEFDTAGNPTVSDRTTFPTFYVYISGVLHPELTSTQSTVKAFVTGYDASNEGNWTPVP
jgi:IPT/TIG domain